MAAQPTPEQLAQIRALARQQFAVAPQPQPVPGVAAAAEPVPQPVQYQGVQPQVQYAPRSEAPRPKAIKAGAIGYSAQQPGPSVVYQAYQA